MLNINQLIGFGAGGADLPVSVTYIGTRSSTSTAATITYSSFSIPRAGLVVAVVARSQSSASTDRALNSMTIGGVSSTIHAKTPVNSDYIIGISSRKVSAGSIDIGATYSSTMNTLDARCAVYLLENYKSATPVASQSNARATNTSSHNIAVNTQAGGAVIYGIADLEFTTHTYSSATRNFPGAGGNLLSTASLLVSVDSTPYTETVTFNPTATADVSAVAVSWR